MLTRSDAVSMLTGVPTFYGATPLTWASSPAQTRKPDHVDIVRLLLKAGATGIDNALQAAVSEGDAAMTKAILDRGGASAAALSGATRGSLRPFTRPTAGRNW